MKNIPLKQLESEIPRGDYCYESEGTYTDENGHTRIKRKVCKYWEHHPEHGNHNDGYCSYLEVGDWMEVDKNAWTNARTGETNYMGLLWDQVKLCNHNPYTKEERLEQSRKWKEWKKAYDEAKKDKDES